MTDLTQLPQLGLVGNFFGLEANEKSFVCRGTPMKIAL